MSLGGGEVILHYLSPVLRRGARGEVLCREELIRLNPPSSLQNLHCAKVPFRGFRGGKGFMDFSAPSYPYISDYCSGIGQETFQPPNYL